MLARALVESRILVTFDRDFGEMVFRRGMSASCGIVLFRISCPSPDVAVRRIVHALESRNDWKGSYAVVEDARVRLVALPAQADAPDAKLQRGAPGTGSA